LSTLHTGCLDEHVPSVLFFRALFDLGMALERHSVDLALVLGSRSPFIFLSEETPNWLDRHIKRLSQTDYAGHLKVIRAELRGRKVSENNKALRKLLHCVAGAIRKRSAADLAGELHKLSERAHTLVGKALEHFGDDRVRARWSQCSRVPLVFVHEAGGRETRCSFETTDKGDAIHVHVGPYRESETPTARGGALRVYFNMPFYFFHEYLSHSFSRWQERLFVEGYLVWAATEMLVRVDGDLVRHQYVMERLKVAELQPGGVGCTAAWYGQNFKERFLKFLLAWAADASGSGQPQDLAIQRKDLDLLASLANLTSAMKRGSEKNALYNGIELALSDSDPRRARKQLRRLARQSIGVPQFTPRLL